MAKIDRYNGNLAAFASASLAGERVVFGGDTTSDDLTTNITAAWLRGWALGLDENGFPTEQAFNAMGFVAGQLLSYLHQAGVPEYNALQVYYIGSFCNYDGILYKSLIDDNVGSQPDTGTTQWQSIYTSPALLGEPTAPTPEAGDDSTKIATTAFVNANASVAFIKTAYPVGCLFMDGNGTLVPPGQGESGIVWTEVTAAQGKLLVGHSATGDWAVAPGAAAGTISTTDPHLLSLDEIPAHNHSYDTGFAGGESNDGTGNDPNRKTATQVNTGAAGGGQTHTHGLTGLLRFGIKIWQRTA
jgi:hypothetical protein